MVFFSASRPCAPVYRHPGAAGVGEYLRAVLSEITDEAVAFDGLSAPAPIRA